MMFYTTLKALHLIAILTWIGGMLATALILSLLRPANGAFLLPERQTLLALGRWNHLVTGPAMVLAWAFGLGLTYLGHWFPAGWLVAKLVLAMSLAALHGMLTGTLRRIAEPTLHRKPGAAWVHAPSGILVVAGLIVFLVLLKPF